MAHLRDLVTSAYGKGALGWCDIAQDMVEEERVCQAGRMQQKDVVIGQLRREIEGLRRRLMREISELKRELAELKCPVPWT